MGFFDLFGKKNVTCARCNATISAGDAQELNGKKFCPACYRRLKQVAAQTSSQSSGRSSGSGSNGGSRPNNEDKFGSKYGDKYGKGGGSSSGGYSGGGSSDSFSGRSSGGYSGGSNLPAPLADIKRVFDETKTKYQENSNGKVWEIVTGFTGKEKNYTIKFMCTSMEDDTLAVRIFGIVSVERHQYSRVYPVLQRLQQKYRFLRFTLDKDGDVNVEYDTVCCGNGAGMVGLEMVVRITQILDECYPELKRAAYL